MGNHFVVFKFICIFAGRKMELNMNGEDATHKRVQTKACFQYAEREQYRQKRQ